MPLRRSIPFTLFVVALSGCAQANPAIQVTGVVSTDQMCTVQVSNPRLLGGVWDVGGGGSYPIAVSIENRMVARMRAPGPLTIESDDFTVKGARVTVEDGGSSLSAPAIVAATYNTDATGFIRAGSDATPTEGIAAIEAIPNAAVPDFVALVPPGTVHDIRLRIQAYGDTSGGSHIDLDEFVFPVTICNGCLSCVGTLPTVICHPGVNGEPYCH